MGLETKRRRRLFSQPKLLRYWDEGLLPKLRYKYKNTHTLVLRRIAIIYRVKTMVALGKKESEKEFAVMRNFTRLR